MSLDYTCQWYNKRFKLKNTADGFLDFGGFWFSFSAFCQLFCLLFFSLNESLEQ
jgi:hypothetical protein